MIRVNGDTLRASCEALLEATAAEDTFCKELCQAYADDAQEISDGTVVGHAGSGPSADELLKQAETLAAQLRAVQASASACKEAQTDLESFRQELEGLQVTIKDEFEKVRNAKGALYDADDEMYILEDDLAAQAETVTALEEACKGKGEVLDAANTELDKVKNENDNLRTAITAGEGAVKTAVDQVRRASAASMAAQELRGQVSTLMLKMALYFDAAVRQPIRDLGLGEGVVISDYFPASVGELAEAKVTEQSLITMRRFCDSDATRKAFAEVAENPEALQELCSFGSAETVDTEIDSAISERMENVKSDLVSVQGWLNEFKGEPGMTVEQAQKNVEGGEPAGLRQVSSFVDATKFYTGYLVHWKVDAKFVKLLASLQRAIEGAVASQTEFEEALADLQVQLAAGIEVYNGAVAAVKAAIEAKVIEETKREAAKQDYNSLIAEQKALEDKLDKLNSALDAAKAAYEAAIAALQASHADATSFLQMLQNTMAKAL
jgi:hypothetical protein